VKVVLGDRADPATISRTSRRLRHQNAAENQQARSSAARLTIRVRVRWALSWPTRVVSRLSRASTVVSTAALAGAAIGPGLTAAGWASSNVSVMLLARVVKLAA
jgi:hypothetical protein